MLTYILLLIPVVFLVSSVAWAVNAVKKGRTPKSAALMQIAAFCIVGIMCIITPVAASAAEDDVPETTAAVAEEQSSGASGWAFIAAALATGLSGIGGGVAVASAAPAAIGATSEDPSAFGKSLIFVALGEGIALYGLLVSILIYSKI